MKKALLNLLVKAGIFCALTITSAFASHQQGNDITYTCIGPGIYQVDLRFFRDCSGIPAANSYMLTARSAGCNNGRTFVLTKIGNAVPGDPYCATSPATCTPGQPNYEEHHYRATVTFTAAEQTCPDWIFSINFTDGNRPATANISGSPVLYSEAYLKLSSAVNNNSPQFNAVNVSVPLVNANKPITIAFTASDPDGDSLAYKLVNAKVSASTQVTYNNYTIPSPATTIHNETNPADYAVIPASGAFSATFPMHSYLVDWSGTSPHPVRRFFELDSITGRLSFVPFFYVPNASANSGANKYNVAVQVSEFRKINGSMVKVGAVTREVIITLVNSGANHNPKAGEITVNNQVFSSPAPLINTNAGVPLTILVNASDQDSADALTLASNAANVLTGAVFNVSNGSRPSATISWVPTAGQVRSQPYFFNVVVKDDACPAKGYHSETIGVRVNTAGAITGALPEAIPALNFVAIPNPFSEEVSFKISVRKPASYILICNAVGQEIDEIPLDMLTNQELRVLWKNASQFAAGTYFAKLISADRSVQTIQFSKLQ